MKLNTDEIASGIMGIKSKAVIKFIFVLVMLISYLLGGITFDIAKEYSSIAFHKWFKDDVMTKNIIDNNGETIEGLSE